MSERKVPVQSMKVYVVTGFKKDDKSGYSLPCSMEIYKSKKAAEEAAGGMNCFTTITEKEVHG